MMCIMRRRFSAHLNRLLEGLTENPALIEPEYVPNLGIKFKTITVNEGSVISYLGMSFHIDREKRQSKVTMDKYVEDVLQICEVNGNAMTSAHRFILYRSGFSIVG